LTTTGHHRRTCQRRPPYPAEPRGGDRPHARTRPRAPLWPQNSDAGDRRRAPGAHHHL